MAIFIFDILINHDSLCFGCYWCGSIFGDDDKIYQNGEVTKEIEEREKV